MLKKKERKVFNYSKIKNDKNGFLLCVKWSTLSLILNEGTLL